MSAQAGPHHHGNLAARLLELAEETVRREGAAALSLRAVAQAARVSPSAAYHHYADRAELLRAVAARALAGLAERMEEAAPPADARLHCGELAVAYVRWAREEPHLFALAFGATRRYGGTAADRQAYDLLLAGLRAALGRPVREDGHEATTRWAAVHGLPALSAGGPLSARPAPALDAEARALAQTVLRGLERPADGP